MGELPVIPPAPAVANAIFDAIGIRLRELPFTPDKILTALGHNDRRYRLLHRPDRWQVAAIRALYPLGVHALLDRVGTRFARSVPAREVEALEQPCSVDELVHGLDREAALLGGGTDLLLQRRQGLRAPVRLLATRDVQEMRSVREAADGSLEIGGAVTLSTIESDDRLPKMVRDAVATIASTQIRATATVAGNLVQAKRCWFFRNGFNCYKRGGWTCPCYAVLGDHRFYHAAVGAHRCQATTPSDLATVLTALDATADIRGRGRHRQVPIGDLYRGPGETVLDDDEVIATISIPAAGVRSRGAFQKLRLWEGDFAVLSAAVAYLDGHEPVARVVFGALAPTPWRAVHTERKLIASGIHDDVLAELDAELTRAAHPLPGNEWKLSAAVGLVRRALADITTRPRAR